jgi:hypothetical protein
VLGILFQKCVLDAFAGPVARQHDVYVARSCGTKALRVQIRALHTKDGTADCLPQRAARCFHWLRVADWLPQDFQRALGHLFTRSDLSFDESRSRVLNSQRGLFLRFFISLGSALVFLNRSLRRQFGDAPLPVVANAPPQQSDLLTVIGTHPFHVLGHEPELRNAFADMRNRLHRLVRIRPSRKRKILAFFSV